MKTSEVDGKVAGYAVYWTSDDTEESILLAEDENLDRAEEKAEKEVERRELVGGFLDTFQLVDD